MAKVEVKLSMVIVIIGFFISWFATAALATTWAFVMHSKVPAIQQQIG